MIYKDRHLTLRDGRVALLRSARPEDAEPLIEYLRVCVGETEYLLRYPEEVTMTVQDERTLLAGMAESPGKMMIVAVVEGQIVGCCNLGRYEREKSRHRASLGISVLRAYWGLGIGGAMLDGVIETAQSIGVSQLELEYIQGNERALALYQKKGFVAVGRKPNAVRLRDGRMLDEIAMIKPLS